MVFSPDAKVGMACHALVVNGSSLEAVAFLSLFLQHSFWLHSQESCFSNPHCSFGRPESSSSIQGGLQKESIHEEQHRLFPRP